jgi:mannan endo-1,6-alpha-mannosidase
LGFPNPPSDKPQWLALAQGVYNTQLPRFDNICGGGLHWQAYSILNGYNYKNSIANGCFFNIASRLAVYTGNASYAANAESTWDWVTSVGFIDESYNVYDGASTLTNCTPVNKAAILVQCGCISPWSGHHVQLCKCKVTSSDFISRLIGFQTQGSQIWYQRVDGLLTSMLSTFFPSGIAYEKHLRSSPHKMFN